MFGVNTNNRFGIFEDDDGKEMSELVEIQKNEQIVKKKAAELAEKAKAKEEVEEKKAQKEKQVSEKANNANDRPERNNQQRNNAVDREDRRKPVGNGVRGPRRDQTNNRDGGRPYRGDRREGGPEVNERRRPAGGPKFENRRPPVEGAEFENRRRPVRGPANERRRRPTGEPESEILPQAPIAEIPTELVESGEEPRSIKADLKGHQKREQPRRHYEKRVQIDENKDKVEDPENNKVESKDRPEDVTPVEEPKEFTLGEYKAKLQQRAKPVFNVRKAGEGNEVKWEKMTELQRQKKADEPEEDLKYDVSAFPQRAGKQKFITDVGFRIDNNRRSAGVSGRGRPRANRRNEAAGDREQRAAVPVPKVHDELDFPSLK